MSRLNPSLRLSLRAAVVGVAALVAPAVLRAQATTPKVFYACYVPTSGTVYRIKEADLSQQCAKSTHVQFSWTDGTPGALSKIVTVTSATQVAEAYSQKYVVLPCPDGSQLVGGGHKVTGFPQPAPFVSISTPDDAGTSWAVFLTNPGASPVAFTVRARCAQ